MKRRFLILLSTLFAIAAITLVIIQITQMRESAKMSDNLFNISVNNAIDEVFNQLDQMKVEDYVSEKERYRLVRYRRIDDMNEKMQDIIRNNSDLFYDEQRISFGVSTQDSAFPLPNARLSPAEENSITQYNTLLNARNRLISTINLFQRAIAKPLTSTTPSTPLNSTSPCSTPLSAKSLSSTASTSTHSIGVLMADADTLSIAATEPTQTTCATRLSNTPSIPTESSLTRASTSSSPSPPPPSSSAATPTSTPSSASA